MIRILIWIMLLSSYNLISQVSQADPQPLTAKDFSNLSTTPPKGLSTQQVTQHLGLYNNYVKKFNALLDTPSENLSRSFFDKKSYSYGGAVLHELYFENMLGENNSSDLSAVSPLYTAIEAQYSSTSQLTQQIIKAGKLSRGWVLWGYNDFTESFEINMLDTHDEGSCLYGFKPLIVLDVYEHAYMIDYGTDKASYLKVFMKSLNWAIVSARYNKLQSISTSTSL